MAEATGSGKKRSGTLFIVFAVLALGAYVYNAARNADDTNTSVNDFNTISTNVNVMASGTTNANTNATPSVVPGNTNVLSKADVLSKEGFWIPAFDAGYAVTPTGPAIVYAFGGTFTNVLTVLSEDANRNLDAGLSNATETPIKANGYDAVRITGASVKDGAITTYLAITVGDTVYFARGTSEFLEAVENEFTLE